MTYVRSDGGGVNGNAYGLRTAGGGPCTLKACVLLNHIVTDCSRHGGGGWSCACHSYGEAGHENKKFYACVLYGRTVIIDFNLLCGENREEFHCSRVVCIIVQSSSFLSSK